MAFDPTPLDERTLRTDPTTLIETSREGVQLLVRQLWGLPATPHPGGALVPLPPAVTPLPRAKQVPKPKPPTKWELFAQQKGIRSKGKRDRMLWDKDQERLRPRFGFQAHSEDWVVEAKPGDDPTTDPFAERATKKKERVAKQQRQQASNQRAAVRQQQSGLALPPPMVALGPRSDRQAVALEAAASVAARATVAGTKTIAKRHVSAADSSAQRRVADRVVKAAEGVNTERLARAALPRLPKKAKAVNPRNRKKR